MTLSIAVEGDTDLPVARLLAADAGLEVALALACGGKDRLDIELPGYVNAAKGAPWLVLRDLDQDESCAPAYLTQRSVSASRWLCFRLAVREIESWLLADVEGLSRFMGVAPTRFPADPDALVSPKRHIVELARKGRAEIRKGMVPLPGRSRPIGPLYESLVIEFGSRHWNLDRASVRSESLRRARAALRALGVAWRSFLDGNAGTAHESRRRKRL